jgi:cation diffusion facilitator family transporter
VGLVADGNHSRTDGLVSLAALAGILGVAAGFERADGLAGVLITVVIAGVIVSSVRGVLGRALDAVDPALMQQVRAIAGSVPRVADVHDVRARWAGRALFVAVSISLPPQLSLSDAHDTAEQVRHALLHEIENLVEVDIHMDPGSDFATAHTLTAHHDEPFPDGHAHDEHDHDDHDEDHQGDRHGDNEHEHGEHARAHPHDASAHS